MNMHVYTTMFCTVRLQKNVTHAPDISQLLLSTSTSTFMTMFVACVCMCVCVCVYVCVCVWC